MTIDLNRRGFLKGAAAAGAALFIGFDPKGVLAAATDHTAQFNPFVKISADGTVTVILKHFEMGQGTTTGLTTLVAEELDADWDTVLVEFAPADEKRYANLAFKSQGTGGSTAIANSFLQYRKAGAAARGVLIQAAAQSWSVPADQITVEKGILSAGDRTAHFGTFVEAAAKLTPPADPKLKSKDAFKLIGKKDLKRKDSLAKTNGSAVFAIDVKIDGMVYAVIKRSPKFGGTVTTVDLAEAHGIDGFIDAKILPNKAGIAVYGKNTWAALKARDAISATWDFSKAETRGTEQMIADSKALLDTPQYNAKKGSDPKTIAAIAGDAAQSVEADFVFPNLAHAPMEPLNCVIEASENGGVRLHDGCQFPSITQPTVAAILGLKPEQVEINTVYAGGSFGRRATPTADYQAEAAMAFDLLGRKKPVKLIWSREDDLAGGYYRPLFVHRVNLGLEADGRIAAWDHRIAGRSIIKGSPFEGFLVQDGVDATSVEGVADTHYAIPKLAVGLSDFATPVTSLWWRSVGHTHTAYVMETVLDMAAHKAGIDPVEYRLNLLPGTDDDQKRLAGALKKAADMADWKTPAPQGHGKGIAVHKSFGTYVAMAAEVAASPDGLKVKKIWCALDCGVAVNPDVIVAQMEGGIGYALGAVMRNEITFTDGEVDQSNFPDYVPLRIADMPEIEVHVIASEAAPSGVGEPSVPPTGPAVANAIFQATGQRITELPFTKAGLDFV